MTTPTFLPPERVREIADNVVLYFPTHNWNDLLVKGILDAAPEIARAVLELAATQFIGGALDNVAEFSPKDVHAALRQMAKEFTDGN